MQKRLAVISVLADVVAAFVNVSITVYVVPVLELHRRFRINRLLISEFLPPFQHSFLFFLHLHFVLAHLLLLVILLLKTVRHVLRRPYQVVHVLDVLLIFRRTLTKFLALCAFLLFLYLPNFGFCVR